MPTRKWAAAAAAVALLACAAYGSEDAATSVRLPDGAVVALTVEGSGPPLVFIHGWACNRTHWREQIPVFARDHRVVALDLPGHGESTADRATWTIEQYGADVAAVVDALALDSVILIGHSMGGPVALEAARRLGPRVGGIVVVDTLHNVETRLDAKMVEGVIQAYRRDFAGTCALAVTRMFVPGADPALVQWVKDGMCATRPEMAVELFERVPAFDGAAAMKAVTAPIRAINAQSEPTAIEVNRKYSRDFDAVVLDGVGHFVQLEAPERFNQALQQALQSFEKGKSP
jgi:pimeloyl-ACP methyl ester carboxylesterase